MEWICGEVTTSCRVISRAKAVTASSRGTLRVVRTRPKVAPMATVITKPKLFVRDGVRFPEIRSSTTSAV